MSCLVAHSLYVELQAPADINGGFTSDYFSMKNIGRVAIFLQVGAVASGAADLTVTLYEATAVAGTGAQALDIPRAYSYDAATDIYTAVTVTAGVFVAAANTTYVIDVDESELSVNDDYDCLAVDVADPGASAIAASFALGYELKQLATSLTN